MAAMLTDRGVSNRLHLDTESMDTIEGARKILETARDQNVTHLIVIAEGFHAWRVKLTFRRLIKDPQRTFEVRTVRTPFGGNSQKRLNSAFSWWMWELAARAYTLLLVWN